MVVELLAAAGGVVLELHQATTTKYVYIYIITILLCKIMSVLCVDEYVSIHRRSPRCSKATYISILLIYFHLLRSNNRAVAVHG